MGSGMDQWAALVMIISMVAGLLVGLLVTLVEHYVGQHREQR
jgi:LPS O-antigen subunit length determinant protein (WzzB/FepE family)